MALRNRILQKRRIIRLRRYRRLLRLLGARRTRKLASNHRRDPPHNEHARARTRMGILLHRPSRRETPRSAPERLELMELRTESMVQRLEERTLRTGTSRIREDNARDVRRDTRPCGQLFLPLARSTNLLAMWRTRLPGRMRMGTHRQRGQTQTCLLLVQANLRRDLQVDGEPTHPLRLKYTMASTLTRRRILV